MTGAVGSCVFNNLIHEDYTKKFTKIPQIPLFQEEFRDFCYDVEMAEIKKICKSCSVELPLDHFGNSYKGKLGKQARCYRCMRDKWFQKEYGVGVEWFEKRLREQKNRCAVCKMKFPFPPFLPPWYNSVRSILDYDRMTRQPRGVVCVKCATILGFVDDDIALMRKMFRYVRKTTG